MDGLGIYREYRAKSTPVIEKYGGKSLSGGEFVDIFVIAKPGNLFQMHKLL